MCEQTKPTKGGLDGGGKGRICFRVGYKDRQQLIICSYVFTFYIDVPCRMSISMTCDMSCVELKKLTCRRVDFSGQDPSGKGVRKEVVHGSHCRPERVGVNWDSYFYSSCIRILMSKSRER